MTRKSQNSILTKCIGIMLILVLILHIEHLNLMKQKEGRNQVKLYCQKQLMDHNSQGILDSSGHFMIHKNIFQSNVAADTHDVSIAIHCSLNNLHYLPNLINTWVGPLSLALYSNCFIEGITVISYLRKCNENIKNMVSFHLVNIMKTDQDKKDCMNKYSTVDKIFQDCALFENKISNLQSHPKLQNRYPINLLRNIAMNEIITKLVFNIDIDIIPSKNLRQNLINFFSNNSQKTILAAYVLPAFEIRKSTNTSKILLEKLDIKSLYLKGKARPFYSELCEHCHNWTDYSKWFLLRETKILCPAYEVEWQHSYEPFFIAHKALLPRFDERFQAYGYNRVSQICEMHVSNWTFKILNEAFVVHLGFKRLRDFTAQKSNQLKNNFKHYVDFIHGLRVIYPFSNKTCKITH